jgi:hypothetical protein
MTIAPQAADDGAVRWSWRGIGGTGNKQPGSSMRGAAAASGRPARFRPLFRRRLGMRREFAQRAERGRGEQRAVRLPLRERVGGRDPLATLELAVLDARGLAVGQLGEEELRVEAARQERRRLPAPRRHEVARVEHERVRLRERGEALAFTRKQCAPRFVARLVRDPARPAGEQHAAFLENLARGGGDHGRGLAFGALDLRRRVGPIGASARERVETAQELSASARCTQNTSSAGTRRWRTTVAASADGFGMAALSYHGVLARAGRPSYRFPPQSSPALCRGFPHAAHCVLLVRLAVLSRPAVADQGRCFPRLQRRRPGEPLNMVLIDLDHDGVDDAWSATRPAVSRLRCHGWRPSGRSRARSPAIPRSLFVLDIDGDRYLDVPSAATRTGRPARSSSPTAANGAWIIRPPSL